MPKYAADVKIYKNKCNVAEKNILLHNSNNIIYK